MKQTNKQTNWYVVISRCPPVWDHLHQPGEGVPIVLFQNKSMTHTLGNIVSLKHSIIFKPPDPNITKHNKKQVIMSIVDESNYKEKPEVFQYELPPGAGFMRARSVDCRWSAGYRGLRSMSEWLCVAQSRSRPTASRPTVLSWNRPLLPRNNFEVDHWSMLNRTNLSAETNSTNFLQLPRNSVDVDPVYAEPNQTL